MAFLTQHTFEDSEPKLDLDTLCDKPSTTGSSPSHDDESDDESDEDLIARHSSRHLIIDLSRESLARLNVDLGLCRIPIKYAI